MKPHGATIARGPSIAGRALLTRLEVRGGREMMFPMESSRVNGEVARRDLYAAVGLATGTLIWNIAGLTGNFFEHFWSESIEAISYGVNMVLLIGAALAVTHTRRAIVILAAAAALMALWSLLGTLYELDLIHSLVPGEASADVPLNFPQPPPVIGPLVPLITGSLVALFSWRALSRVSRSATSAGSRHAAE